MELRQLRYLATAVREASFTRAAQTLHVVQPAVSQQIRKLEAELGIDLLHRVGGLRPTRAGERVIVRAERILSEVDALRDEVNAELGLLTGRISIGSMQWLGPINLPRLLGDFLAEHPQVHVTLGEDTSTAMLEAVRREKLDIAFLSAHGLPSRRGTSGGIETFVLTEEEIVLIGTPSMLAAIERPTSLRDLDEKDFIGFADGMDLRTLLDELFGNSAVKPRVVLESNQLATVRAYASHGVGFALIPQGLVSVSREPVESRSVEPPIEVRSLDPPVYRQLVLAWRSNHRLAPAAAAFREFVLESLTEA